MPYVSGKSEEPGHLEKGGLAPHARDLSPHCVGCKALVYQAHPEGVLVHICVAATYPFHRSPCMHTLYQSVASALLN